jgi:hypothetical protein
MHWNKIVHEMNMWDANNATVIAIRKEVISGARCPSGSIANLALRCVRFKPPRESHPSVCQGLKTVPEDNNNMWQRSVAE